MINRSMPGATVIPELHYPDVAAAADWLCAAFGFTVRWRVGGHRAQLNVGDGCVVVHESQDGEPLTAGHSVMVRVEDADAHCRAAREQGATITGEPTDQMYGERQYNAVDLAGHHWTFSQTIDDVDPASWGAEVGQLR